MQTFSQFRPTPFDPKGLALDDKQDWLVLSVSRTRDSGPLAESNFDNALEALGGEGDNVEVHRFGHWGPGWFEIIIVKPGTDEAKKAEEIEAALADYPVLNEEDWINREHDEYDKAWNDWLACDFIRCLKSEFNLSQATEWLLDDADSESVRSLYEELTPSGDYYTFDGDSLCIGSRLKNAANRCTRERIAGFLRSIRNGGVK